MARRRYLSTAPGRCDRHTSALPQCEQCRLGSTSIFHLEQLPWLGARRFDSSGREIRVGTAFLDNRRDEKGYAFSGRYANGKNAALQITSITGPAAGVERMKPSSEKSLGTQWEPVGICHAIECQRWEQPFSLSLSDYLGWARSRIKVDIR
jgi:hypothetical protein